MKYLQKIVSVLLMSMCLLGLAVPVAATTSYAEHEGLQVTVTMDKEKYDPGEAITATITVVNTRAETVTIVNLEQLIPEGYTLAEDSQASMQNIQLQPGQTLELQVTFSGTPEQSGESGDSDSFLDKLLYGQTWGIPNLVLAVILLIGFVVFMLLT